MTTPVKYSSPTLYPKLPTTAVCDDASNHTITTTTTTTTKPVMTKSNQAAAMKKLVVWLADFVSVVCIVLCNKLLMGPPGNFRFPISLPAAHFAMTALASSALQRVVGGANESKATAKAQSPELAPLQQTGSSDTSSITQKPRMDIAIFILASSAAIITVNISLLLNSVAFYQMMKMLTLPFVAAVDAMTSKKKAYGWRHVFAFACIMTGVALTIEGELSSSFAGSAVALVSVVCAGCSQLLCCKLQTKYNAGPTQLLAIMSPYKAALFFAIGPTLNYLCFTRAWIFAYAWTPTSFLRFAASCIIAIAVNLSQFTAIRVFGPTMYSALGQIKTIALVVIGSLVFQKTITIQNLLGIGIAFGGVWSLACIT
jgi:solute carrier family 35, member E3